MTTFELIEQFIAETKERLGYDDFHIYFSASNPLVGELEGMFTSEQLRVIAEQLDRFNAEMAKLTGQTDVASDAAIDITPPSTAI